MQKGFWLAGTLALLFASAAATGDTVALAMIGQDLRVSGGDITRFRGEDGRHILVVEGNVSVSIGANTFSGGDAVLWIEPVEETHRGRERMTYVVMAYFERNVSVVRAMGASTTELTQKTLSRGDALAARFAVTGKIFQNSLRSREADPSETAIYLRASEAIGQMKVTRLGRIVPATGEPARIVEEAEATPKVAGGRDILRSLFGEPAPAEASLDAVKQFRHPLNIQPLDGTGYDIEYSKGPEGTSIATVVGRFYLWQRRDEQDSMVELAADTAVIFFTDRSAMEGGIQGRTDAEAIYLGGNVVMMEGLRTVRADELYYDFVNQQALAVNAEMRTFDKDRGIPVYIRAAKIRQVAADRFTAEDIVLTTSEFYTPQLSLRASRVIVTDSATVDAHAGELAERRFTTELEHVKVKAGETTVFAWPRMQTGLESPDLPVRKLHFSYDTTYGPSVETRWYLSRLLGLREPEGTDGAWLLDYYGKRGPGTGLDITYERDSFFGSLDAYIIRDKGEDDLGDVSWRRNLEPSQETRGQLTFRHRQFLPHSWQVTTEVSQLSDRNFLESFYPDQFYNDKEQETLVYLKRLQENWAFSLLGKVRINSFQDTLEETPAAEFHVAGKSLFDDEFTFYSSTSAAYLSQRRGSPGLTVDDNRFRFFSTRNELDMPLSVANFKVVPYVAVTAGYDGRSGFNFDLARGRAGDYTRGHLAVGETGVRLSTEYWRVDPGVASRLWDVNGLRHVVRPYLTAAGFKSSDDVFRPRDIVQVGVTQLWETKRGPADNLRNVEWMRLNTEMVFVERAAGSPGAPNRFLWNNPMPSLHTIAAPDIFNADLRPNVGPGLTTFEDTEVSRNYFAADYSWRITDTTAMLSDAYYDLHAGQVQQADLGFTHLHYPDLSYYIGTRYLRNVEVLDERGTNSVTLAVTYVVDPRYTVIYSQQYDFDYGGNIQSEFAVIRRYHRTFVGLTFGLNDSLDRQSIVFSIWPQGVRELAVGSRRYIGVGGAAGSF